MILYSYFRSTAAYRVRIALNLKELDYQVIPIDLLEDGGQHRKANYLDKNPQGLIPLLLDDDRALSQSLAIMEYLEEQYPDPALLPRDSFARAYVRSFAQNIASDMHPLNNLRVLMYLRNELKLDESQVLHWYHHWLKLGFDGIENRLRDQQNETGFVYGDHPTLADICLAAQLYNAHRFNFELKEYPIIQAIEAHCSEIPAFKEAHPTLQKDSV